MKPHLPYPSPLGCLVRSTPIALPDGAAAARRRGRFDSSRREGYRPKHWARTGAAICLAIFVGLITGSSLAAEVYRVAVVDPNRVVESSPQYEAAGKALQSEVEDRERGLRVQQEQITELQRKLEHDGDLMSESELQHLKNDIRSRNRKLKYAQDEFQEDFALRQNELRTKLARQVQEVVVKLAKELEIDLVISEGLVYYSTRIDISDQVIDRLKQEFSDK